MCGKFPDFNDARGRLAGLYGISIVRELLQGMWSERLCSKV